MTDKDEGSLQALLGLFRLFTQDVPGAERRLWSLSHPGLIAGIAFSLMLILVAVMLVLMGLPSPSATAMILIVPSLFAGVATYVAVRRIARRELGER